MRFGLDPGGHYHDYYDIETQNDRNDIELMISKGEYSDALFEEEEE